MYQFRTRAVLKKCVGQSLRIFSLGWLVTYVTYFRSEFWTR